MNKETALAEIENARREVRSANLRGADLRDANLRDACLSGANLSGANLCGANLCGADLCDANLREANLRDANLRDADLPAPQMVLMAAWGVVSGALCVELMRYDAASHPEPERFDAWADGGGCPYADCRWQRAANFTEKRELYAPGPSMRPIELAEMVLDEKCPGWREEA